MEIEKHLKSIPEEEQMMRPKKPRDLALIAYWYTVGQQHSETSEKEKLKLMRGALEFYSGKGETALNWDEVNNPKAVQDHGKKAREVLSEVDKL